MTVKKKVRPNLTNYDVLEFIQEELRQSEKRIVRKVIFTVSSGVLMDYYLSFWSLRRKVNLYVTMPQKP